MRIGPFEVVMKADYPDRVRRLSQHESRETDPIDGSVTYQEAVLGEWIATADLEDTSAETTDTSLLTVTNEVDNGLWDLLEILTFLTGRRVTTEDQTYKYSPHFFGEATCSPSELPMAAQCAWENRRTLVDRGFKLAFLSYNLGLTQGCIQTIACMNNTALNSVVDQTAPQVNYLGRDAARALTGQLKGLVTATSGLTPIQLNDVHRELDCVLARAANGAVPRFIRCLQSLGIVSASPSEETLRRTKWVNKLRNALVHTGEIRVGGIVRPQLGPVAGLIVYQIVPAICARVFGEMLGFSQDGLGLRCMDTNDLTEFFSSGRWGTWEVETQDVRDWFYGEE